MTGRQTEILIGKRIIKKKFGIGGRTFEAWVRAGAPITCKDGIYRAETYDLWAWLETQDKKKLLSPA
jgi:hypothetical protein